MEIAYSLASEELHPTDMVHAARRAEELGFQSVWLSDHFHPWIDRQGQSPFVWTAPFEHRSSGAVAPQASSARSGVARLRARGR